MHNRKKTDYIIRDKSEIMIDILVAIHECNYVRISDKTEK